MASVKVASLSELKEGQIKHVKIGGRDALAVKIADEVHCMESECTHKGGPLHEGRLEGCAVVCPWHGAKFDLKTGKPLTPPATLPVKVHKVSIKGSDVFAEE